MVFLFSSVHCNLESDFCILQIIKCLKAISYQLCKFTFTGGEIASTFDHPELVKLGTCNLIEEVMIGEDKLIHFSGVAMGRLYLWGGFIWVKREG